LNISDFIRDAIKLEREGFWNRPEVVEDQES